MIQEIAKGFYPFLRKNFILSFLKAEIKVEYVLEKKKT